MSKSIADLCAQLVDCRDKTVKQHQQTCEDAARKIPGLISQLEKIAGGANIPEFKKVMASSERASKEVQQSQLRAGLAQMEIDNFTKRYR